MAPAAHAAAAVVRAATWEADAAKSSAVTKTEYNTFTKQQKTGHAALGKRVNNRTSNEDRKRGKRGAEESTVLCG